jgi:hypothetical protein
MSLSSSVAKELKTLYNSQPSATATKMSSTLSQTAVSSSFPHDHGSLALPNSDSTNDMYVGTQIPTPFVAPKEAQCSSDIQSVETIYISTVEE